MKELSLILFLAALLPLHAENWLQNGDFSDGIDHWHGSGLAPSDVAPANPFDPPDPFTSKGLIIQLKPSHWQKVAQDFKGKLANGVLTISYMVSPDLAFSTKPDDYVNMPGQIDYNGWQAFNTPHGAWVLFLSDFGSSRGHYYTITPQLGSSKVQTLNLPVQDMTPYEDKTITLAFPPGKGTIVFLNVQLTDK
ncbi:MAG: hypothetical protein LV479_06870 [Methylacidiphilales bacterium]|nr:hypothetical protein [Candidatus Methylacidiphilales bacterium]